MGGRKIRPAGDVNRASRVRLALYQAASPQPSPPPLHALKEEPRFSEGSLTPGARPPYYEGTAEFRDHVPHTSEVQT